METKCFRGISPNWDSNVVLTPFRMLHLEATSTDHHNTTQGEHGGAHTLQYLEFKVFDSLYSVCWGQCYAILGMLWVKIEPGDLLCDVFCSSRTRCTRISYLLSALFQTSTAYGSLSCFCLEVLQCLQKLECTTRKTGGISGVAKNSRDAGIPSPPLFSSSDTPNQPV